MVVRPDHESGQSVLEFLLMLPLLVGITILLVRINTAIQMAIVNQQYARSQALYLTYSSPIYPNLNLRKASLDDKRYNAMVIGVSDNPTLVNATIKAEASTFYVARKRGPLVGDSDEPKVEPDRRSKVRIRNTVVLCSQPNLVGDQPLIDLIEVVEGNTQRKSARPAPNSVWRMGEATTFDYCRGNT